jgi:ATP-dependent Clp protease ATP-binding subunit ClpX
MNEDNIFYGILLDVYNIELNEASKELCRLLFINPLITVDKATELLWMIKNKPKLIAVLQEKEKEIAEYCAEISKEGKEKLLLHKLTTWTLTYGDLTASEIDEFKKFHDIEYLDEHTLRSALENLHITRINSPGDIKLLLDRYVIGQERAKKSICFAFYLHLLRIGKLSPSILNQTTEEIQKPRLNLPKPNMLIVGSTGTGKTYMLKTLCKLFDVPFVKIDCASLTSSGYYGKSPEDYVIELYKKLNFDKSKLETAIIYFDEVDKLSEKFTHKGSVGGIEVQQEFLNLLEDDEWIVQPKKDSRVETFQFNAQNLMFIFSGSFAGIENTISKRISGPNTLGFKGKFDKEDNQLMSKIIPQDIIDFGIIPELVGRINFIEALDSLTVEDIKTILKHGKDSPLERYQNFFKMHLDELVIEDAVFDLIASEVIKRGGGGRTIQTVMQQLLKEYLFKAPNNVAERYVVNETYFNDIFKA